MKSIIFLPFFIFAIVTARPQDVHEDKFDTLKEGVDETIKDISTALNSKTGAITIIGGSAFNLTADAAGAASNGLGQAANYLSNITLQSMENRLNSTEDAIKAHKIAMIHAIFNAKRSILNTLGGWKYGIHTGLGAVSNSLSNMYSTAMGQITIAANITSDITTNTIPNTLGTLTWNNFVSSISGAYNSTSDSLTSTGNALVTSMLGVKQQIHEALENFDSQESLEQLNNNVVLSLNSTLQGTATLGHTWGVFQAFDNIIEGIRNVSIGLGQFPVKVQTIYLGGKTEETIDGNRIKRNMESDEISIPLFPEDETTSEEEKTDDQEMDRIIPEEEVVDETTSGEEKTDDQEMDRIIPEEEVADETTSEEEKTDDQEKDRIKRNMDSDEEVGKDIHKKKERYDDYEIFSEGNDEDEEDERIRRSLEQVENLSMEELDDILENELKFWNALNDILTRQNRMIKTDVPK